MPWLTIDARDFLRGISTYDELSDGGYSPSSKGINPFVSPGLIKPGAAISSGASTLTGAADGLFGWSTWHTNVAPGITRAIGGSGSSNFDGKFYTMSDTGALTLGATDASRDYKPGISSMIRYKGNFYITSTTDIAMCNFDFSTNDFVYWRTTKGRTALQSGYPHPMCVYGDILYIADGRYLHKIDGTTATEQVLILPEDYVISDLEVYNNKIFMAAAKYQALAEDVPATEARVFTWDSLPSSFVDEFPLQDPIDTLKTFGGALMVFTQTTFGYWNGGTINPLRQITNRVYKYRVSITKDRLYYADGTSIVCFGNPSVTNPRFFSIPLEAEGSITALFCPRPGKIIVSSLTTTYGTDNIDQSTATGKIFYSNKYNLRYYSKIKEVIVVTEALASGSDIDLAYLDSVEAVRTIGSYDFATLGAVSFRRFEVNNDIPTFTFQLKATFTATPNKGIRRVFVRYEPTGDKPNS